LVKANDYQNAEIKKNIALWDNINNWILSVMKKQTPKTLVYKIELDKNKISDLSFLMKDYVEYLEHHLDQMIK
jgi:F0F1-type ATP synthase delta subunit